MFLPSAFTVTDTNIINTFVRRYPFATLSTALDDTLQANHLPLHLITGSDGQATALWGHLARLNPLVKQLASQPDQSTPCLCIFHGSDAYISPNWYETKRQTGKAVPTWDYQVAHAHGHLQLKDNAEWLLRCLNRLTDEHEASFSPPWKINDAPQDYIDNMLKAIAGIEISIDKLLMKSKLNQNHPQGNQIGIVEGLQGETTDKQTDIAALVQSNLDAKN